MQSSMTGEMQATLTQLRSITTLLHGLIELKKTSETNPELDCLARANTRGLRLTKLSCKLA